MTTGDHARTAPRRYITDRAVAELLGVSLVSVRHARLGRGALVDLPFVRVGRSIRYDVVAVEAWIQAHTTTGA